MTPDSMLHAVNITDYAKDVDQRRPLVPWAHGHRGPLREPSSGLELGMKTAAVTPGSRPFVPKKLPGEQSRCDVVDDAAADADDYYYQEVDTVSPSEIPLNKGLVVPVAGSAMGLPSAIRPFL